MNQLQIVNKNGQLLVGSKEVAEMVDKRHSDLIRSIDNYSQVLLNAKMRSADFFITNSYKDTSGKENRCYLLTRKGCDMVANKLTGEKGILFTAAYVTQFENMEEQIKKQQQQPNSPLQALQMAINQMVVQEQKMIQLEQQVTTVQHRLDNYDRIDTVGDLQQRLNKMIKRYAHQEKMTISSAWRAFTDAFNTAYRTNLKLKITNYKEKHGLKELSRPQYLSLTNQLEDAVRVADKLLNKGSATA
ncbi:Rha family transcriptional regulator [Bacillus sp. BP-3]|uniref:Rha family transcriptional regulator n=1 Tax=Bacillus sp. BP-3 TaxID=3022773 RepID=UPI00232E952A|nr:Rha family transcriptional regulator [Bacillus sp. BP-3]MDC2867538.1 Rha family transcriptional regulator [Bacillus sp. BP-3]